MPQTHSWRGDAAAFAHIDRFTPANVQVGDKFTITAYNGKEVSFTATAATVANVTAGLAAAWNANQVAEIQEATATDAGTYVQLTGKTAGLPLSFTGSVVESGGAHGAALTKTSVQAATGPNHWNNAANWTTGAIPAAGDTVLIEGPTSSIFYGIDQAGVTLALLVITNYTGKIGLPRISDSGKYAEPRETWLKIGATSVVVNAPQCGRIKLKTGTAQTAIEVQAMGNSAEPGAGAFQWIGAHAANTAQVSQGSGDFVMEGGSTGQMATLRVGYTSNVNGDARVRCGAGLTLGKLEQSGGDVTLACSVTATEKTDGTLTVTGAATCGTLENDKGSANWRSSGTLSLARIGNAGKLSFVGDMRPKAVTNCEVYAGGEIEDPFGVATWTNGIDLKRTSAKAVKIDVGVNRRLSVSDVP